MWLVVRNGDARGTKIRVTGETFLIGRDDTCDLSLRDAKISRRHAVLALRPEGTATLRDLGSSNGTYVNGQRVESAVLAGREQIQVGETVLASSLDEPSSNGGATMLGSGIFGAARQTQSAVHRMLLQRSVRRATILGASGMVFALAVVVLFALGLFPFAGGREATAVQRVVQRAAPSTVFVEARRQGQRVESGTGWVLDARRGLIVTGAHVLNGGTEFSVGADDGLHPAKIVAVAPCEDLAVLRVGGATGLRTLSLGSQAGLRLGETVVAVGYPANASQEANLTLTTGVVSIVRSSYREPTLDVPRYANVVQTDAAINPGNSGGPLLDLRGRLIGVNVAGRTLAGGRIIQGQNYAIGVDRVRQVAARLRTGSSIGWTGMSFEYPTPRELRMENLPLGLLAGPAVPGTAADRAGLGHSREVLVAVNGVPLDNSLASYCDAVAGVSSGGLVTLTVRSPDAGASRNVRLRLE
jgi:putative serine protease PepD